jgi:hypothetical protein
MPIRPTLPALLAVLLAGCFEDSTPQHSDFLPFDYQHSFQTVRACRLVADHDFAYEKVLANALASAPYVGASYPLPAGSVVVGEQHGDPSCNSLTGYYLMAKEPPGYDPASADWHWQRLDTNQRVVEDGRLQKCSSCHAKQPPCIDYLCAPP